MQIFRTTPIKGTPLRTAGIWEGIRRMARAWETLDVHNGHIDWSFGRPTIVVYGEGGEGGGGGGERTDHYFLAEAGHSDPEQGVKVLIREGASKVWGKQLEHHASHESDYFTGDFVAYAKFDLSEFDWDTDGGFVKFDEQLPSPDENYEYFLIAAMSVSGEGTGVDPYGLSGIKQAHVGVLVVFPAIRLGEEDGQLLVWDHEGQDWVLLPPPQEGQVLGWDNGIAWVSPEVMATPDHNDLNGLQGGGGGNYYHLSEEEYNRLTEDPGDPGDPGEPGEPGDGDCGEHPSDGGGGSHPGGGEGPPGGGGDIHPGGPDCFTTS